MTYSPSRLLLLAGTLAASFFFTEVGAQAPLPAENVVSLTASATIEVSSDLLTMQLAATREGADPAQVQAQIKALLEQALSDARRSAQPGQMDVRTGDFRLTPRYGREGRISAWVGSAELVLEGRDFQRIAQAAGRLPAMTLNGVWFGLSRETREQVERDAQAQAVQRFRTRAMELARSFGFTSYSLREVTVHGNEPGLPRPRMAAMEARVMTADAPVPVEAGKTAVLVTVTGSVQLR